MEIDSELTDLMQTIAQKSLRLMTSFKQKPFETPVFF